MRQNDVVSGGEPGAYSRSSLAITLEILVNGAQSRVRLAERLNLSPPSLTRLVKPLLAEGVLVESEAVRSSALGRSSQLLDVVEDDYRFVGIKLVTDAAYGVCTDLRGRILRRETAPIDATAPEAVGDLIGALVQRVSGSDRIDGVGVTLGGRVQEGVVVDSPYMGWTNVRLGDLVGDAPATVHVENDVVGLTRAQHWFGAAHGYPGFALLTVGAGIGYGLVLGGELVSIETGPVAHLPVHPGGPLCSSGHRGCLASYATVSSITSAASVGHRSTLTFDEVVDLAREDDLIARRVLADAAWAVGRAAAVVGDVTSVPRVILMGEAVVIAQIAPESLRAGLDEYRPAGVPPVEVVVESADFYDWARGAAVVAIRNEFPRRPPRRHVGQDRV